MTRKELWRMAYRMRRISKDEWRRYAPGIVVVLFSHGMTNHGARLLAWLAHTAYMQRETETGGRIYL